MRFEGLTGVEGATVCSVFGAHPGTAAAIPAPATARAAVFRKSLRLFSMILVLNPKINNSIKM